MAKKRQQQTPYDTVFDFIFGTYKPPKDRRKPGLPVTMPPMGLVGDIVGQIAMTPYMYPTNQFMGDLDREIDSLAMKKFHPVAGVDVKVGPSSLAKMIGNPRGFINKAFEDYEAGKKWGKWGGVTRGMDSALVAIMAKRAGFSAGTAVSLGYSSLAADAGMDAQLVSMGYATSQESSYQAQRTAANNLAQYAELKYGGSRKDYQSIIAESQKAVVTPGSSPSYKDKEARRRKVIEKMVARGVPLTDATNFANKVWGDAGAIIDAGLESAVGKNLGIWFHGGDGQNDPADPSGKTIAKGHFNNSDYVKSSAFSTSLDLIQARIEQIDKKALLTPLTSDERRQKGRLEKLNKWMTDYSGGKTPMFAFGRRIGAVMHYQQWFQNDIMSGKLVSALLWGNTKDLNDIFKFEGMRENVWTPLGNLTTLIGSYHPVNYIKGLSWNGKTWELYANSRLFKGSRFEGFFKGVAGLAPSRLMSRGFRSVNFVGRGFNNATTAVKTRIAKMAAKILNVDFKDLMGVPIKEMLKQVFTKLLASLLGGAILPGVGVIAGFLANTVIGLVMKLAKPATELIVLLLFGGVALVMILCTGGVSMLGRTSRYLNVPLTATGGYEPTGNVVWADDSTPPSDDSCLVSTGGISCQQGPDGSFSHTRLKSRAVDLTWTGMGGSSEIVAPSDGTVIAAQTSGVCRDGTNYGGTIKVKDSSGYVWTIMHVRPLVYVGASVSKGDAIADVQFQPEVEEGDCWTGAHAHIQIQNPQDKYVDAEEFLTGVGCVFTCP